MKTIALFPGQGSQRVGMGKNLYENFREAKETFEEASDALSEDLKKLCFEDPDSALVLTHNTQPALLTVSIAAFRVASARTGFKPDALAGHSLGEYSALVAGGAIPFSIAVHWVRARGFAMQAAVPVGKGGMCAVLNVEDEIVQTLCEKASNEESIVEPANFNAPGQLVVSGNVEAVQKLSELIATSGIPRAKAVILDVSAPFHCRLMEPARVKMAELFKASGFTPQSLLTPYLPNRTAEMERDRDRILELLLEQIDHPVRWRASIENCVKSGFTHAIEFGAGKVLQGLCKRIPVGEKTLEASGVEDAAGIQTLEERRAPK